MTWRVRIDITLSKDKETADKLPAHDSRTGEIKAKPASDKQLSLIDTLAKQKDLHGDRLQTFVTSVLGRADWSEMTTRDAHAVISALNAIVMDKLFDEDGDD